ncbi:hypothetical protein [Ornithinimicrobium kibberense]|uniref:hypothetical protein n=1 Tax=Ornithinimicrobium kibberense TaxID=282060 RepID=UPI00361D9419
MPNGQDFCTVTTRRPAATASPEGSSCPVSSPGWVPGPTVVRCWCCWCGRSWSAAWSPWSAPRTRTSPRASRWRGPRRRRSSAPWPRSCPRREARRARSCSGRTTADASTRGTGRRPS